MVILYSVVFYAQSTIFPFFLCVVAVLFLFHYHFIIISLFIPFYFGIIAKNVGCFQKWSNIMLAIFFF